METTRLGYQVVLKDSCAEDALPRIVEALAADGFGIVTQMDVPAIMRTKLHVQFPPYLILGVCNPDLAHCALEADPEVGLLLPCNVVLRQSGKQVVLAVVNLNVLSRLMDDEMLLSIMTEADERLRRVIQSLE